MSSADVAKGIDHRQDDQAEGERNPGMRDGTSAHLVDHDRAGPGKDIPPIRINDVACQDVEEGFLDAVRLGKAAHDDGLLPRTMLCDLPIGLAARGVIHGLPVASLLLEGDPGHGLKEAFIEADRVNGRNG